jgi:phage minor structural protein, N-terminal domain protein
VKRVRIAVLDSHDNALAYLDNFAPGALHYYDDELHLYLKGATYTYSFTCSSRHEDSQYIVEGNKLSFLEDGHGYYLNIMHVEKDEYEITAKCYGTVFELLNEEVGAYAAASAMTFVQYLNVFDPEGTVSIGINEVADKSITNEWTGTETVLARLYSLATVFSAEIEFVTVLNDDYSLKQIVANVYREHSDEYQGIGQNRTDFTLRYGREIEGIRKTSDVTNLYTAIRPTGTDGLRITDLNKIEYDESGAVEYRSSAGDDAIRAVQARERYPSNLTRKEDGYIMRVWSYDTDNVNVLYGQALAQLKKLCQPEISYEVSGNVDADIGDTVRVVDQEYSPALYLSARITELVRSFTDPSKEKAVFDNTTELQPEIDQGLLNRMEEMVQANLSYSAYINSSSGLVFKNGAGSTNLIAYVARGREDVTADVDLMWFKDGSQQGTGQMLTVEAADIEGTAIYLLRASNKNGDTVASAQATITNVEDGEKGETGPAGQTPQMMINADGHLIAIYDD